MTSNHLVPYFLGIVIYNIDSAGSGTLSQVYATLTTVGVAGVSFAVSVTSDSSFNKLAFGVYNGKPNMI